MFRLVKKRIEVNFKVSLTSGKTNVLLSFSLVLFSINVFKLDATMPRSLLDTRPSCTSSAAIPSAESV